MNMRGKRQCANVWEFYNIFFTYTNVDRILKKLRILIKRIDDFYTFNVINACKRYILFHYCQQY